MKLLTISFAVAAFAAAPGFAGGPTVIADDPAPAAAPAAVAVHDWSGAYVGLGYGSTSADRTFGALSFPPLPASTISLTDGTAASLYAGYLFQRGALVYGGKLSWSRLSDTGPGLVLDGGLDRAIDVKARLGFAANRVLVYGILGYSQVNYSAPVDDSYSTSGPAFGLGIDVAASQRLSVGLEYLVRRTEGNLDFPDRSVDIDIETLSLRVSFNF